MASLVDQLAERVPHLDGSFRRRFAAGGLLILPAVVFSSRMAGVSPEDFGLDWKDILSSHVAALGLLVLIYAAGHVVELIGEVFIARTAGNLVWSILAPLQFFQDKPKWLRYSLRAIAWYPGLAFLGYYQFFKGLIGISSYKWIGLPDALSVEARHVFESFPSIVQRSLQEPFGNYSDIAWQYLRVNTPKAQKNWINKSESRNKDILTIMTALFILFSAFASLSTEATTPKRATTLAIGVALLYFLSLGYFLVLRKSILGILEIISCDALPFSATVQTKDLGRPELNSEPPDLRDREPSGLLEGQSVPLLTTVTPSTTEEHDPVRSGH